MDDGRPAAEPEGTELGEPVPAAAAAAAVLLLLLVAIRGGDGGVPATVEGVPVPEERLPAAANGLLVAVVLGLLFVVEGAAGDREKKLLMSVGG